MSNEFTKNVSNSNNRNFITLDEYRGLVINNPLIAQTSTQRIYKMISSHGKTTSPTGDIEYNFFKGRIFGSERQIDRIMSYFKGASLGLDIKKRVLLLLGPPGGGKSLFLSHIKKGLADYSRTSEGSLYAIQGCPINEEPFHLYEDEELRKKMWENHKIKIEGKLCPFCKHRLEKEWNNNLSNAQIERIYIDEETRTGIGTFAPSEKNNMSELYGSTNLRKIEDYGNEGDPRSYDFNGELHKANRGIMEFIEVLKADPTFLHILLTLAEEQQFKTPRFPLQYVDEALIAHTNEGEFLRFIQNRENEAVIDRLFIIHMPYNLDPSNEELIYHSALYSKLSIKGISIHPGAIRLASEFVCLTRSSDVQKLLHRISTTGSSKIKEVDPASDSVNPDEEFFKDGMQGFSPRFILNGLAIAMVESSDAIVSVESFYHTMRQLINDYPVLSNYSRKLYLKFLDTLFLKKRDFFESLTLEDVELGKLNTKTKGNFFN
jgi:serine protein kinase